MKLKNLTICAILTLLVIWSFQDGVKIFGLLGQITDLQSDMVKLQQEIQDIQNNYISTDDLQPVLDEMYDLDQRLIPVEEDVQFYKAIWSDYFGMEVGE